MSFWQIFERINRIARSSTADTFGGRSRFDDELRRAQELIDGERRREEEEKREKEKGKSGGAKEEQRPGRDGMSVERACAIIGVPVTATMQEIQSAYRRRVAEVHPDRYSNRPAAEQSEAVARTQQLNEAYAFLKSERAT